MLVVAASMSKGMCLYSEYEVKAAYIFNFAKFLEWPTSKLNNDTIILAIYKDDPFGVVIEKTMVGRKANNKVWKIVRTNKLKDLDNCQIAFFSDIQKYELVKILDHLNSKPILTIGDEIIDFCELGGTINFTPQFSEYQFEINNEIAKAHRIVISHKLLLLAKIVTNSEDEF
jgi:hypothetical protein